MVNTVLTANGEALSSDSIYDIEDVINNANNFVLSADAVVDRLMSTSMTVDEVNTVSHMMSETRQAVGAAHSAFHELFDQVRVSSSKASTAPRLDEASGMAELLYLAAKSLQDEHERAAMTEGVFQILTILKEAGR